MRKRFIYLGVAAVAMLVSSCQAEKLGQGVSGEVDFTISTSIPSGMTTYADGEGSAASHLGGATNLDKDAYDLRYIMEVYTKDGDFVYRAVKTSDDFGGVSFEARLLAKEYDFVFWADFVKQGQTEDYIYDTDNLKSITVSDRRAGKDEADAYYAVKSVDMTASGQNLGQVVLKRPFGKIRMVATDKLSDGAVGETPTSAEITYGSDFKVPNTFNALEGKASGEMEAGAYSFEVYQEDAVVSGDTKSGAYIIGYDYIFASDANTSYNFDVVISGASGQIGQRSLSSIPVQENKLTTIIGNFYTNETSLEVVVEDSFDDDIQIVSGDKKALLDVAANGGEITLDSDCIFSEEAFVINPGAGKIVTINLNGHTIKSTNKNYDAIKVESGTLVINGEGNVGGEEGYYAVWAVNDSKVILNGGNYYGNGTCIQAKDNAAVEINGGYYRVGEPYNGVYFVVNLQDNQPNTAVIKGGRFENFNPADTNTEPAGVNDDFVADGYKSEQISDDPVVYEVTAE